MRCVSLAVILLCILFILSLPVQTQVSFFQPTTFPDCPYGPLFVNDFNGDGKLDLLCGYGVLDLGNGDGTFKAGTPPAGQVLAVADFNHDGKPDLLEEKPNSSSFSVLLGNGDGTFQAAIDTPTGGTLGLMAAGDLNGDGYADVLGSYGSVLYVFLGKGDGTFQPGIPNNLGSDGAGTISIADVNGDGKLDVVYSVGSESQPEVLVLLGKGDGTLQAPIVSPGLPPYFYPSETVVGDFNGDGKPDLVSTASYYPGSSLFLSLGNGDGTFQAATAVLSNIAGNFAAADVNGDGKPDLVFAGGSSHDRSFGTITQIYLGNGDGTFSQPSSYVSNFPIYSPNIPDDSVVIADFNGDGKLDIASSGGILLGNGDGTFQGIPLATLNKQAFAAAIGDFEKNGKPDVAALDSAQLAPFNLYILHNNGNGSLTLLHTYPLAAQAWQVLVGDLNGDGNLDLVVTDYLSPGYSVLLGNGDGSFQSPVFYSQSARFGPATLVDVNNDKKLDLVEAGADDPVGVSLGNGDGTFATTVIYEGGGWSSNLMTGDFNGDGKVDISVGAPLESAGTLIFYGNGDGTFQAPIIPVDLNSYSATSTADFRNIGRADLFNGSQVALNNGDGTFTFLPSLKYSGFPVSDIVGDGKVDLFVNYAGQSGCQTGVELGNGDGTFGSLINVPASGCYPFTNLVADMNGDGKPDIVFLWGSGVGVLLNTTPPGFALSASSPSPAPVIAGGSATSTVTGIPIFGSNGAETLSCIGLPSGVSCAFNPTSISSSSKTSTLTITTSSSTAAGTYPVQIQGVVGSVTDSVTTSLVVQAAPAPDFSISFGAGANTSLTITAGQTDSSNLQVKPTGSFAGTVDLSCAVTPAVAGAPTCTLASTSVQVSVGKTRLVSLEIGTTAPAASGTAPYVRFPAGPMSLVWSLMFLGSACLWARNRKRLPVLAAPIVVLAFAFSVGCGGSGSSSHTTPVGTYTATVTGTSGSISHSFVFHLIVQ